MLKMVLALLFLMAITTTLGHSMGENFVEDNFHLNEYDIEENDEPFDSNATDHWRLPEGIKPISYAIQIIPNLDESNFTYVGNITIDVVAEEVLDRITLHATDLTITDHSVIGSDGTDCFVKATQEEGDYYILMLSTNTTANASYTIKMNFAGKLRDDMFGFYKSSYTGKDNSTEWMATTQFEATSARKAFPCFDEPHLKANFTISLARPSNMSTLCNMPLKDVGTEDLNLPEGYVWDNYEESPKMSTYLVAFTVSKFHHDNSSFTSMDNESKPFTVWAPENTIDQVKYSLEVGPRILEIMQNLTGFDYVLPKMDLIAIPDFNAGAMENWGLVTFREADLFYKEGVSSANSRQRVATVIAHELAHQWFGDVLHPQWRLMEQFVVDMLQTAFLLDVQDVAHPITHNVLTVNDIYAVFDNIVYNKAGSVIRMMEHILGEDTFFKGLWNYLNSRQYDSGNEDQLFEGLDEAAKENNVPLPVNVTMTEIMHGWTHQVGFPLLTVVRNFTQGNALIRQERFMTSNANESWTIPLSFTTQSNPNFNDTTPNNWIMENQREIMITDLPLEKEWIIFNIQVTGYYRVNYDDENWKLITDYLNSDNHVKIHVLNKAQLVCDSLNLAKAGYLNYNHALGLTSYLARETDFIPWSSAYNPFDFLSSRIGNSSASEKYIVLLAKIYDSLKFNETSNEDPVESLTISEVVPWACKYQYKNCITMSKQLFKDFLENGISVPVNLKKAVYCYGISEGFTEEWNKLWEIASSTNVASEKLLILNALGCTKSDVIIESYLNKTLLDDGQIRKQDRTIVFNSVLATAQGLSVGINFLIENFEQMRASYGERETKDILLAIADRVSSKEQIEKLTTFVKSNKATLGAVGVQAQKTMDDNSHWNQKYAKTIEDWLNRRRRRRSNRAQKIFSLDCDFNEKTVERVIRKTSKQWNHLRISTLNL
ncbi:hypothetical protein J437_LFUL010189 [Ladona fulva]|uniref:Aminopeptidase n=1 Tax=Ladona fulva TaxID=123851 RepID=A0A8K0P1P6_LADFU|nr:hypothetical protein J437_LFUL010189 [Ladona fulva]